MRPSIKPLIRLLAACLTCGTLTAHAVVMVYPEKPWREIDIFPRAGIAADGRTIVVDGKLDDWNPVVFYHLYNNEAVRDEFALAVAFAYDERGLWFAARFSDRNPMLNKCNPAVNHRDAWDGDSFQFRLTEIAKPVNRDKSDNIALVTVWNYSETGVPAVHLAYGMDMHDEVVLTGQESGLAILPVDGGYIIEGFLSYAQLRQQPAAANRQWRFQVQGNFSDASGKAVHVVYDCFSSRVSFFRDPRGWGHANFVAPDDLPARLAAKQAAEQRKQVGKDAGLPTVPFVYRNPADGFVSLAVRNADGQLVRTLRMKDPRQAGEVTDTWDGLDDDGQPVPAGTYTIHGLTHPGLESRFVTSVHNSGTPPWQGVDSASQWGGDHLPAIDVTCDDASNAYLVWGTDEKGHGIIKVSPAGRKLWGASSSGGDISRDGVTAVAVDGERVYLAKSAGVAGVIAYKADTGERDVFANGESILLVSSDYRDLLNAALPPTHSNPRLNLADILCEAGHLYAALHKENLIRVFRLDTGAKVAELAVDHPLALAWNRATGELHAISGNALVAIAQPLGEAKVRAIAANLDQPRGLAVDAAGTSWIALRGKAQQVIGVDREGQQVATVGKVGGRPWVGAYDPAGMLNPAGIAADGRGRLWVIEEDLMPSRQSLWDTRTGALVQEFFGGSKYAPMMAPDPEAPENVFIHNTRFVVDYERGTATPAATVYRKDYRPATLLGAEYRYEFMGQTFQIASYGGKKFAYDGHGGVYAYSDGEFRPLLHIGQAFRGLPGIEPGTTGRELAKGIGAVWRDRDGNGSFSEGEVRLLPGTNLLPNIESFGGTFFPGARFIAGRRIFAPAGLDDQGIPIYPEPEDAPPILTGDGPMRGFRVWADVWPSLGDDWQSFYLLASQGGTARTGDGKTEGLYRFTRDGAILWRYAPVAIGFGLNKNLSKPGELFGALRILGQIQLPEANGGEIVGVMCYRGYGGFVTGDGLFVDHFGTDVGYGPPADYDTLFVECFNGYFFRHARTGKVYLFTGVTDGRIVELSGWERIRRLEPVDVVIAPEQHERTVQALAAAQTETAAPAPLTAPFAAGQWGEPATIVFGNGHQASVALRWDADYLAARFDVQDASPWKNASTDWRYDFKGGDAIDLQLGLDRPPTPRKTPAFLPGDVRVIVTPGNGPKGYRAIALWKRVPPGLAAEPWTYRSPVAEETFERVALLDQVTLTVTATATGYVAEVAIPWSELHVRPEKGQTWRGDVGVLLSDRAGSRTVLRRYRFNRDTNIVDDVPAESRFLPAAWGLIHFR